MAIFFKPKARLVIMSHMSDVQESLGIEGKETVRQNDIRINFVKFLILKYGENLNVEIDPDEEYEIFKYKHAELFM
jgi:hypothetical protein